MTDIDIVPARKVSGRVVGTFVTAEKSAKGFQTSAVDSLTLELDGIVGSRHQGWIASADARVPYLPRGTPMRNTRHLSIVSIEDLAEAALRLRIAKLDARWIGANLLLEGITNLSFLPRGTRIFCQGGAILQIEDQNAPCRGSGAAIASHHPGRPELELDFPKHAKRLRGLVASVEHSGIITAGSAVDARILEQWLYS